MDQDPRGFKNKDKLAIKEMEKKNEFPVIYNQKVDLSKIDLTNIRPWIQSTIAELTGEDDEIATEYCFAQLESEQKVQEKETKLNPKTHKVYHVDPKKLQLYMKGILLDKAAPFCCVLWAMLLELQKGGEAAQSLQEKRIEQKAKFKLDQPEEEQQWREQKTAVDGLNDAFTRKQELDALPETQEDEIERIFRHQGGVRQIRPEMQKKDNSRALRLGTACLDNGPMPTTSQERSWTAGQTGHAPKRDPHMLTGAALERRGQKFKDDEDVESERNEHEHRRHREIREPDKYASDRASDRGSSRRDRGNEDRGYRNHDSSNRYVWDGRSSPPRQSRRERRSARDSRSQSKSRSRTPSRFSGGAEVIRQGEESRFSDSGIRTFPVAPAPPPSVSAPDIASMQANAWKAGVMML